MYPLKNESPFPRSFSAKIILLFLFFLLPSFSNLVAVESVTYERFGKQKMESFYKEASQYKEETRWDDLANRGKEIVRAEWERGVWEALVAGDQSPESLDDIETVFNSLVAEWEADAMEDFFFNRGEWKAQQQIDELTLVFDQATIDQVRLWAEEAEQQAHLLSSAEGLEVWGVVESRVSSLRNAKVLQLQEKKAELSSLARPEEQEGFLNNLDIFGIIEFRKWMWEMDSQWVLKRNDWLSKRMQDTSLRAQSELGTAESVVNSVIQTARENADKSVAQTLQSGNEGGEWDSSSDPEHYEAALSSGLQEWSDAMSLFYAEWDAWQRKADLDLAAGQKIWSDGYRKIISERDLWVEKFRQDYRLGAQEWESKLQEILADRQDAELRLQEYNRISALAWSDHIDGIRTVTLEGADFEKKATENIAWYSNRNRIAPSTVYAAGEQRWRNIRAEIRTSISQAESILYDQDLWGTPGFFVSDSVESDLYLRSEDALELEMLILEKQHWERQLSIMQAALAYATSSPNTRESKDSTEAALANAESAFLIASSNYNVSLQVLDSTLKTEMDQKSEALESARANLNTAQAQMDESLRLFEIARLGLMALEDTDIMRLLKSDLSNSTAQVKQLSSSLRTSFLEYKSETSAFILEDLRFRMITELKEAYDSLQTKKDLLAAFQNLTNSGDKFLTAQTILNDERFWVGRNDAKGELASLLSTTADNEWETIQKNSHLNLALGKLGSELQTDLLLTELLNNILQGTLDDNAVQAQKALLVKDRDSRVVGEIFASTSAISSALETLDPLGINLAEDAKASLLSYIEDNNVDSSGIASIIKFAEENAVLLSSFSLADADKPALLAELKNDAALVHEIALLVKTAVDSGDLYSPQRLQNLLYDLYHSESEAANGACEILRSGLENMPYYEFTTAQVGSASDFDDLLQNVGNVFGMFQKNPELAQQIVSATGISRTERYDDTSETTLRRKTEDFLEAYRIAQQAGFADEGIAAAVASLQNAIYKLDYALYADQHRKNTNLNPEAEESELNLLQSELESGLETLSNISYLASAGLSPTSLHEAISQSLSTSAWFEKEASTVFKQAFEGYSASIQNVKIENVIRSYIALPALDPSLFVSALSGFSEDEKAEISSRIMPFYLLNCYSTKKNEIRDAGNLRNWLAGFGISSAQLDWTQSEILNEDYLALLDEFVAEGTVTLSGEYLGELRPFIEAKLFLQFQLDNPTIDLSTEEGRSAAASAFCHSRSDIGTNSADLARIASLATELHGGKDLAEFLPDALLLRIAKGNYERQHGSSSTYLRDEDEIATWLSTFPNRIESDLRDYIQRVKEILDWAPWMDQKQYADDHCDEIGFYELLSYVSGNSQILSASYEQGIYGGGELESAQKSASDKLSLLLDELVNERTILAEMSGKNMAKLSIIRTWIATASSEAEKSWRTYLPTTPVSGVYEQTSDLKTDKADRYYLGDDSLEEARKALEGVRDSLLDALHLTYSLADCKNELDHLQDEIRADGFDFSARLASETSSKAAQDQKRQEAFAAYSATNQLMEQHFETIRRSGEVLSGIQGISVSAYQNTVLLPAQNAVDAARQVFTNSQSKLESLTGEYKLAQEAYMDGLSELKQLGSIMDDAELDHAKAMAKYRYALNAYVEVSSSSAQENVRSATMSKMDLQDEYDRIVAQVNLITQRVQERTALVQASKDVDDFNSDADLNLLTGRFEESWKNRAAVENAMEIFAREQGEAARRLTKAEEAYNTAVANFFPQSSVDQATYDRLLDNVLTGKYPTEFLMRADTGFDSGLFLDGFAWFSQTYGNLSITKNEFEILRSNISVVRNMDMRSHNLAEAQKQASNSYAQLWGVRGTMIAAMTYMFILAPTAWFNPVAFGIAYASYFAACLVYNAADADYRAKENARRAAQAALNTEINSYNASVADINNKKSELLNARAGVARLATATNLQTLRNVLSSPQYGLSTNDISNLTESDILDKFNISNMKHPEGYNIISVLSAYGVWSRTRSESAWQNVENTASTKGYEHEDLLAAKSSSLRRIQQSLTQRRNGEAYSLVSSDLADIGDEVYKEVVTQADILQRKTWDLKTDAVQLEYQRWNDTMALQQERGIGQWDRMEQEYLRLWRSWTKDTERKMEEKNNRYIALEQQLRNNRDAWMKDLVENGIALRQEEIRQSVLDGLASIEEQETVDVSLDASGIADRILSAMRPTSVSTRLVNAARAIDCSFSLAYARKSGWNGSVADNFRSRMSQYVREMEQTAKLRLAQSVEDQVEEMDRSFEKALDEQDQAYRNGMNEMFRNSDFSIGGDMYQRDVTVSSTILSGDEKKKQSIPVYISFADRSIDYAFAQKGRLTGLGESEIDLYCRKAMDELQKLFTQKQELLVAHFGTAPTYNDKGEISAAGSGEQGRLVAAMVEADKERAKGKALEEMPIYKKNLSKNIPVNVSTIVKTGLMFVPGGQTASLAITMMENMAELASGRMSAAQFGISLLTSAVSAGMSYLGNAAGALIEKGVGVATRALDITGKVLGSVVRTAMGTVGDMVNQGFKVNAKGGIDWRYEKDEDVWGKTKRGFYSGLASGVVGGVLNGALSVRPDGKSALLLGEQRWNEKLGTVSSLAGGLAGELVNLGYTGEFNMNILSLGTIMSKWNPSGKRQGGSMSFLETWADTMYKSDADISRIQNLGLGMNISKKGISFSSETKGWDVGEMTMDAGYWMYDNGIKIIDRLQNKDYYTWVDEQISEYEFRNKGRIELGNQNLLSPENERLKSSLDLRSYEQYYADLKKESKLELEKIAKENEMTVEQLMALNPQTSLNNYMLGDTLNVDKQSLVPKKDSDYIFNGVNYSQLMEDKEFVFYKEDGKTPNVSKIQMEAFLATKKTFLNEYKIKGKSVSDIIYEKAQINNVNPMVLLSQMQGEQCILSTIKKPNQKTIDWILNVGAYDYIDEKSGKRSVKYKEEFKGIEKQINGAFKTYKDHFNDFINKENVLDVMYTDIFNVKNSCLGKGKIKINNAATYALYKYTPWISDPNVYLSSKKIGGSQMTLNIIRKNYMNKLKESK